MIAIMLNIKLFLGEYILNLGAKLLCFPLRVLPHEKSNDVVRRSRNGGLGGRERTERTPVPTVIYTSVFHMVWQLWQIEERRFCDR